MIKDKKMKTIILIAFIFFYSNVFSKDFKLDEKNLKRNEIDLINKQIKKFKAFDFDKSKVLDEFNATGNQVLKVDTGDNYFIEFYLELNDLRSPDFRAIHTTDVGVLEYENYIPNTYKGFTKNGDEVRFIIDSRNFHGVIYSENKKIIISEVNLDAGFEVGNDVQFEVITNENDCD